MHGRCRSVGAPTAGRTGQPRPILLHDRRRRRTVGPVSLHGSVVVGTPAPTHHVLSDNVAPATGSNSNDPHVTREEGVKHMTIYGLEEHLATTEVVAAWKRADPGLTEPMRRWAVEVTSPGRHLTLTAGASRLWTTPGSTWRFSRSPPRVFKACPPRTLSHYRAERRTPSPPPRDDIPNACRASRRSPRPLRAWPPPKCSAVVELGLNGAMINARGAQGPPGQ